MGKVYIETNGCAVQRHETQRYASFFRINGWTEVDEPKKADIVLLTTCGVVDWTEEDAIQALSRLTRDVRDDAILLVGGCLPKINPERIASIHPNITMFGPKEAGILNNIIMSKVRLEDVTFVFGDVRKHSFGDPTIEYTFEEISELKTAQFLDELFQTDRFLNIYDYLTRGRHFWQEENICEVKVASGCHRKCTYCATKFAIGDLTSEPMARVLSDVERGVEAGYNKIVLMGDEVGYYGVDCGSNLVELVDKIDKIEGDFSIALRYIYPDALIDQYDNLKRHFDSGRIYYFCSAFQSGSNRILKLMGRKSNIEEFIGVISDIGSRYENVFKHTQIIVGFPGEEEVDFSETLSVLSRCIFDYITATAYSDRINTPASMLPNHLSTNEVEKRYAEMLNYIQTNRNDQLWRRIGKEVSRQSLR